MESIQIESEENYKDLFDSAHDLIHIVHLDGRLIYVNKSWTNLLEYSLNEVIGKSVYSIVEPGQLEQFINYRNSIINGTADDTVIVVNFISKTGRKITLEGSVFLKLKDGKPHYTRGIFRDITHRLQQEEKLIQYTKELKEREDNLQQLLINAPDAVIVIDQDGFITFWSTKSELLFGWTSEEVMGMPLSNTIIPQQYRQAHAAGMKRYLATGEAHVINKTIEITALNKAGKEFFVSLTISTTQQKNSTAFIAFIRDISEQKKNQIELEQKTQELTRSNQKLEQFAHIASHDMKEPIRKIKVFNRLVIDEYGHAIHQTALGYLQKIERSVDRLYAMVEGVLRYATIEGISEPVTIVEVNKTISNVLDDLEVVIQEKKAIISVGNIPDFNGYPVMIYQLFYNLIYNAIKFSRDTEPPRIEISGRILEDKIVASQKIEIIVQDNGIGFQQENAAKIFEIFARLHSKDKYEGTGLGLSLSKEIIERHKGTIRAESEPGKGARFIIIIPQNSFLAI